MLNMLINVCSLSGESVELNLVVVNSFHCVLVVVQNFEELHSNRCTS